MSKRIEYLNNVKRQSTIRKYFRGEKKRCIYIYIYIYIYVSRVCRKTITEKRGREKQQVNHIATIINFVRIKAKFYFFVRFLKNKLIIVDLYICIEMTRH